MIKLILEFLLIAAAVILTENLVPGITVSADWQTIAMVALVWGILVTMIRPILRILTFPITIITLGLSSVLINIGLFYLLTFIPGFQVASTFSLIMGTLVLCLLTSAIQKAL